MENFSKKITWFMQLPEKKDLCMANTNAFLQSCELLSSGRDALLRILKLEKFSDTQTLWIPEYFCPSVVRILRKVANVKFYFDSPIEQSPNFETLTPAENDAVLIVNFFGWRNFQLWQDWQNSQTKKLIFIEDHSHAPFSNWAMNTKADYSFASLRKTLPLPDGAYLKKKNSLPHKIFQSGGELSAFASDMLSASTLQNLSLTNIAKRTAQNLKIFCENFADSKNCIELNRKFGNIDNTTSVFNPILKFTDMRNRDKCHNALFEIGVMPSIYWGGLGKSVSAQSHLVCDTTLAIPVDFRHSADDVVRIAKFINTCTHCE